MPFVMSAECMTVIVIALIIAIGLVGYEALQLAKPQYRDGCEECSHAKQRDAEARRELAHDIQHRGVKAPGMPAPTVDRWDCDDPACPRNRRS